jgi:hypothetical protein
MKLYMFRTVPLSIIRILRAGSGWNLEINLSGWFYYKKFIMMHGHMNVKFFDLCISLLVWSCNTNYVSQELNLCVLVSLSTRRPYRAPIKSVLAVKSHSYLK